ncbi:MAG: hypothetical protein RLZZ503_115 [Actinomycetota bacterium]|jgi:hypothetical protein
MNLDALIEDLEAEGYFASSGSEVNKDNEDYCKLILVVRQNNPDIYLSLPLLGKDFIAGFTATTSKGSWMVIQDYIFMRPQDLGTSIQKTKATLKEIVKKHLIGSAAKLSLAASESEYTGYIVGTSGRILEFVTFDAQRMLIPMKSIKSLVVEKLSM